MAATLKRKRPEDPDLPKRAQKKAVGDAVADKEQSDEDEDEEAEGGEHDPQTARKPSKKLPSASDLRAINEATNLFKSNTFRYQIDGLLASVHPKESHTMPLERTLQRLYAHMTSLPSIPPTHPLEAASALHEVSTAPNFMEKGRPSAPSVAIPYPLPLPPQTTAWKVAFEPPQALNVVGSWRDHLPVRKPDGAPYGVDVVVEMPASLFQENDYKNSRFFYKRAFYVACLATFLTQARLNLEVEYEATEGDVRRTALVLTPKKDGSEYDFHKLRAAIRIIPTLSDDAPIPVHRLSPAQSNIRDVNVSSPSAPLKTSAPRSGSQSSTPLYNNTLSLSFARTSRTRLLGTHQLAHSMPSFRDGLTLLRVWANQRGFGAGAACSVMDRNGNGSGKGVRSAGRAQNYCVRGFEGLGAWWACVLEVLLLGEEPTGDTGNVNKRHKGPLVGKGVSSYQLFRAALDFLAKRDFESEAVFMKVVDWGQKWNLREWTAHYEAVFVDATGTVNMLAGVPTSSLELLRHDAKSTLYMLNKTQDPFDSVFLTDMREAHTRFDAVIRIDLTRVRHHSHANLDFPSTQAATLHSLASTVRKALNTRAHAVVLLQPHSPLRPLTAAHPVPLATLTLGVIFDPAHATRLVDHGPALSTPEVDAFSAFWGPKAELRRFKDGRILESCVWDEGVARAEDREGVPPRIVRYILRHHFGIADEDVCIIAGDYGRVVMAPPVRGRGEGGYKDALAAYDKVVRELKALEDVGELPLMLVVAKPASPSLRYTSVFPPSPVPSSATFIHPSTTYLPAFDMVLQLERSSRWPDDLRAIQKVKLAFLETMARGLMRRHGVACRACVVVDPNVSDIEDGGALEVVLNGWAFHARIEHDREVTLLQGVLGDSSKRAGQPTPSAQERQAATRALHVYRRRFVHAPAHHSAVLALYHRLPAFSYTVRLVKRWLGAHWLSARVTEEAVELICARVFLLHEGDVPACGKRGFVRVMAFLKDWDGMAYVPLYEAVKEGDPVVREHKIVAGKGRWRLMTAEDVDGTVWCEGITTPVAERVQAVAKATALCLEDTTTFWPLFQHPTTDYDFLIELDPRVMSRYWQSVHAEPSVWNPSGYANLANGDEGGPARVGFDVAELFFRDLQTVYGDTIELFYDIHGGTTIGGVWNPAVVGIERHPWKVFPGFSSLPLTQGVPQKKKPTVTFNTKGVLAEIERMGAGLVTKITIRQ